MMKLLPVFAVLFGSAFYLNGNLLAAETSEEMEYKGCVACSRPRAANDVCTVKLSSVTQDQGGRYTAFSNGIALTGNFEVVKKAGSIELEPSCYKLKGSVGRGREKKYVEVTMDSDCKTPLSYQELVMVESIYFGGLIPVISKCRLF